MVYLIVMIVMFALSTVMLLMSIGSVSMLKQQNPKWTPDPPGVITNGFRVFRLLAAAAGIFMMWQVVLLAPGLFIYGVFAIYTASILVGVFRVMVQSHKDPYKEGSAVGAMLYSLLMSILLVGFWISL